MAGMMPAMEIGSAGAPEPLGEGNSFAVAAPDHPIKRVVAVSIKASLNDLCLQKARGTWAPSQEALRNICKLHHSNHFGTDGLRPNVGDTERACCSFAQSSNANCESCPPPAPRAAAFTLSCRLPTVRLRASVGSTSLDGSAEAMGDLKVCQSGHTPPPPR